MNKRLCANMVMECDGFGGRKEEGKGVKNVVEGGGSVKFEHLSKC